jgi:cysteine desulfurase/selenocysteine lyase
VAVAQVSNVLGTRFPVERIAARAREVGAYVIADCAQSFLSCGLDVAALGADFIAFSAHKAFGPDGLGTLWGKPELLETMPPFMLGGDMVEKVSWRRATFERPPLRFESGTQNASAAYAFSVAIKYIERLGRPEIKRHEASLTERLLEGMREISYLKIYGNPQADDDRHGIVAFNVIGQSPFLVARHLDSRGVIARAGTHCAQPLHAYLGAAATCRVSLGPYNTIDDVDRIIDALKAFPEMLVTPVLSRTR